MVYLLWRVILETANTQTDLKPDMRVAAALMRAQEKFDPILKDTNNPFYRSKYAALDQVISATRPHLRAEGLVIVQKNIQDGERSGINTRLIHLESGEELTSSLLAKPKEDTIQQIAGVLTYCRRYEYHTITGTASEDDDANEASGKADVRPQSGQAQAPPKTNPTPVASRASQNKAPNTPTTAIAAPSAHDPAPVAPQPIPVSATPSVTPAESTPTADPNGLPTKEQYDAYINRAVKLTADLEKAGLKAGQGLPTKTKLKKYIFHAAKVTDLKSLTVAQWDILFDEFEKVLSTGGDKELIGYIEKANAKEGK